MTSNTLGCSINALLYGVHLIPLPQPQYSLNNSLLVILPLSLITSISSLVLSELVDLDEYTLLNTEERQRDNGEKDVNPFLHQKMTVVGKYLHEKFIKPTYKNSEYMYYNVWDGVDKDNQGWHTDFMEGYDLFFLYFLQDEIL